MLLYSVTATTIETIATGTLHRQTPAFLLNADTFGIRDERDAEAIARRIINPAGRADLVVDACAVKLLTVEPAAPPEPANFPCVACGADLNAPKRHPRRCDCLDCTQARTEAYREAAPLFGSLVQDQPRLF